MRYQGLELDPFQARAVTAIQEEQSLIVAAPTGCGKTLIAEYAVDLSIDKKKKAVYTAPIKALSNQKYRDFRKRFGEEMVGIHTGDVTINPDGQLLIMTTEIFRNLVLENSSRLDDVHYAVFDEIHYLDDMERGTVWEESIILAPRHIRFMCLSATVPNLQEISNWMTTVRDTDFEVIEEKVRPVPLRHFLFSAKYGNITLKGIRKKFRKSPGLRKKFLRKRPSSRKIIHHVLRDRNTPVLYFCFNRRACENNAEKFTQVDLLSSDEKIELIKLVDDLITQYRLQDYDRLGRMRRLWEAGCAYHHAGILPAAKEIVERLFNSGLIKLLFCTETFALGINMPARAVIFDQLEKFDGVDFKYLMTREYNQMAGRAGRRGMDEQGYVYSQVIPEATDPREIERLFYGKNEKIVSRFSASYSTILNLYTQFGDDVLDIFSKSFANFKSGVFANTKLYRREEEQIKARIQFLKSNGYLNGTSLTRKGLLAASVSGWDIQCAELHYSNSFAECTVEQLPVVLGGLISDSKRNRRNAPLTGVRLKFAAEKVINRLRRREIKFGIINPIREYDYSMAAPLFAWANGCSLKELEAFGIPEGDIIRLLRMVVQLLRTLRDKLPDPVMAERMHEALVLVNRDVVDAQAELEVDLPENAPESSPQ
ncbi:MAG: DEAD/DEAH box helicase [Chitinivibrionales bacterium]|nr:DEAD/DEAH box helicase [Chitinivibrionales bacterium]